MDDLIMDDDAYYSARDDMDFANDDMDYPAFENVDYPAVEDVANPETQDVDRNSMDLRQFCRRAKNLLSHDQPAFVRFVLTGQDTDGSQASIDPVFNRVTQRETLNIIRDYDSVLGISSHIRVQTSIDVSPVSKHDDTLSKNVHIEYEFRTANGFLKEKIHKVPNLCIGKWRTRNMIRVFIPGLYNEHTRSPFLSEEDQRTFYEKGLLPAVQELCQGRSAEWPAKYSDEMFRARGRNGTLNFQSKVIPVWNVGRLGSTIRSKLRQAGIPWATGIVFLHQIRGLKDSTIHSPDAANQALEEFLDQESLDPETITAGDWWIDVGIQVSSVARNCLAWRTDSHGRIVKEVCGISERHAQRLTSVGSSQYTRDMTSHLPQVSGCRIEPGVRGRGPNEITYLQLYTTDKSHTYHPEKGHHGKFITCGDVVKGRADGFINSLYDLYINAIEGSESQARMEIRVPSRFAASVLQDLDGDVIRSALVSFPSVEWWSLRAYRAKAIQLVLGWQAEGIWELRAAMPALLLTAGCVWLLNGLHSVPDNGPSSRELMDCILPQVNRRGAEEMFLAYGRAIDEDDGDEYEDDDYDDRMTLPANIHGLVFFRSLRLGQRHPVPRLSSGEGLSDESFRYLFGIAFDEIESGFFSSTRVQRSRPPIRSNNKTKRTKRYVPPDDAPPQTLFHLQARGVELLPPIRDEGSDLESEGGGAMEEAQGGIDKKLTTLWLQFIYDVTQKAPNRKSAKEDGYCKLSAEQRAAPHDGLYKNLMLSEFFNDCQWRMASGDEWDTAFDHLFPVGDKPPKVQNYRPSLYFEKWNVIKKGADEETLETIRRALKDKFDALLWFPYAQADRMWPTRVYENRFDKFINVGKPAPWVICRRRPFWE